MRARDIMATRFHTLRPGQSIADAVKAFHTSSTEEQKKIFGMMVIDEQDRLVGMLSMYDILLFVRPKHAGLWGEMEDLPLEGAFDELLERVKPVRVADIMTTDVVTIGPDTHVMVILYEKKAVTQVLAYKKADFNQKAVDAAIAAAKKQAKM